MPIENVNEKCCTVIWKLENASYSLREFDKSIKSSSFTVDEIYETNWKLELNLSREEIGLFLQRQDDMKIVKNINITCEFAFLLADGTVSCFYYDTWYVEDDCIGTSRFAVLNEVFRERRSVFLPQDILTIRCKIWKKGDEMSKNVQYFARTRIGVEKSSFLWNIEKFSFFPLGSKRTYEIKSPSTGKKVMILEIFLSGGMSYDETVRFKIIPCRKNMKNSNLQVSIVDAFKNTVKCFQDEFLVRDPCHSKDFTLFYSKRELIKRKNVYLPDNVLSLLCTCVFSVGITLEEIERINYNSTLFEKKELSDCCLGKENDLTVPKSIFIDNLKSMLNNSCLSDVKLKTKSQTFLAHKFILGAQSPVFKAMFSTDMKENISDCINIEDMNDDTVSRFLHYIYSAEVGELEWDIATELYEAADKYQVLSLKDICSSYLKNNLGPSNTCKALILADMHQDNDLEGFVQNFILQHSVDIINSEEWDQLMETHLKLAAKTMCLKFKM